MLCWRISSCFVLRRTDRNKSRRTKALPLLYIIHPLSNFSQITFSCNTSPYKGHEKKMYIMTEILNRTKLIRNILISLIFCILKFGWRRWICRCDFNLKKRMTAVLRAACRICQDFLPPDLQLCPRRISQISPFRGFPDFRRKDFLVLRKKILLPGMEDGGGGPSAHLVGIYYLPQNKRKQSKPGR